MKVCVTGGSGFIGSYMCEQLVARGDDVVVLDLHEPSDRTCRVADRLQYIRGDIRDPAVVDRALAGCDAMMNLAAAHHDFGIAERTYYDVNEGASHVLCEAMDAHGIRTACFYSTVAVYGTAPYPHEETTTPQPDSPYGASKLAGEAVFQKWTQQGDGRTCLVIRPTVTFGRHNFANMYSLIRQIAGGRFVRVGPGTNIKSLSYVENLVDATLYLWNRDGVPAPPAFDVYNYIDKPDLTSREIAETIYDALGRRPPRASVPMWLARLGALPFDLVIALTGRNIPISSARVKKLFSTQTKFEADKILAAGYQPKVPLREGIRRMVQWYVEEGRRESAEWRQPPAEIVRREPVAAV